GREPLVVASERRRQLPEKRAQLRGVEERLDAAEQQRQVLVGVDEALGVRDVAAHLDREDEVHRRLRDPAGDGTRARQAVERAVQLDGVEELRVVAQPPRRWAALGIEDAVPPVGVVPARAADANY